MDIQNLILSLLYDGAPAMVISGWISMKWTHAEGIGAQVQSWGVAIVLVILGSLTGYIGIPISDVWQWLLAGLTNGLIANLLYKSGVLDAILIALKAKEPKVTP